jgi:hypothetical protein
MTVSAMFWDMAAMYKAVSVTLVYIQFRPAFVSVMQLVVSVLVQLHYHMTSYMETMLSSLCIDKWFFHCTLSVCTFGFVPAALGIFCHRCSAASPPSAVVFETHPFHTLLNMQSMKTTAT